MKKLIAYLMVSVCLLSFMSSVANAETKVMYVLVRDELTVRSKASLGSDRIGYLFPGDPVEVTRNYRGWSHLDNLGCEEGSGWVSSNYLVDSEVTIFEDGLTAVIEANGRVAVRASVDGKRVGWLSPRDEVIVYAMCKDWAVTSEGYIKSEFLHIDASLVSDMSRESSI